MSTRFIAVTATLVSALAACQPTHMSAVNLAAYTTDPTHSLYQVQQVAGTEVGVTYQPVDLLIARELGERVANGVAVDSLRAKYAGSAYFLLTLSRHNQELLQPGSGFAEYSDLLQTLAFRMGNHMQLITSQGDTLRPSNYYLDRTYAKASSSQLLIAFPIRPTTGEWQFYLGEFGLGTGNLHFRFDCQLLRNAPQLAMN